MARGLRSSGRRPGTGAGPQLDATAEVLNVSVERRGGVGGVAAAIWP